MKSVHRPETGRYTGKRNEASRDKINRRHNTRISASSGTNGVSCSGSMGFWTCQKAIRKDESVENILLNL